MAAVRTARREPAAVAITILPEEQKGDQARGNGFRAPPLPSLSRKEEVEPDSSPAKDPAAPGGELKKARAQPKSPTHSYVMPIASQKMCRLTHLPIYPIFHPILEPLHS